MLSILTVTRMDPYAQPFLRAMASLARLVRGEFVLVIDMFGRVLPSGAPAADRYELNVATDICDGARVVAVQSKGYIESVLDEALTHCRGDYVLRLDDDERCSPAMVTWLREERYRAADHWKFPRMHLWPNEQTVLMTPHLWPDHQTRLSVPAKAGGRQMVHAGSPFGGGAEAPVALEHHKFIVKSYTERRAVAARYDAVCPGFGTGTMAPFSLPEDAYASQDVELVPRWDGFHFWPDEGSRLHRMPQAVSR